jgi:peptide/nickel transport system substrate-binding protein
MTVRRRIGRNFLLMLATSAAAIGAALTAAAAQTTFKIVMHSDLKSFDPVWSGAYIVRNCGYMVYDVLFAIDGEFRVKPQMAESVCASSDGLTHTIARREGLIWHNGSPVTAEDCVASLKRWSARDPMGQKLAHFLKEYRVIDARTFEIVLKEIFGPLLRVAWQTERGRAVHDAQARR